ncbi:MAG: type VI secretion system needle protein Hcp [Flavobacteriales bacterium]|jgi:hypothetical protein|nr:type VI secretion system needle protein Hcp [Flavobacteriales bacterium]
MAFRADLLIDGKEYRLLHCSYALQRDVDATGRPSSEVKGGTIHFEIESTEDTSLWDLMIAQYNSMDGSIVFKKRDEDAKMKELKFETAYVVDLSENFDSVGDNPMSLSFTLSAHKLTLGSETHENAWPI